MRRVARLFLDGKTIKSGSPELQYIHEHILARTYGWTLSEIRAMDYYDFQVHLELCSMSELAERKWDITVATGKSPK